MSEITVPFKLVYRPGTEPPRTEIDITTSADAEAIFTDTDGFIGMRGRYSEPTCSFTVRASGVTRELAIKLLQVLREIEAAAEK